MQNEKGGTWIPLLALLGLVLAALACGSSSVELTLTAPAMATESPDPTLPPGTPDALADFAAVDQALQRAIEGSVAYNAPESMRLEETVDVQLLVSPTESPEALEEEITESGPVASATISVTPWMQAELRAANPRAFEVTPYHDEARQLVGTAEATEWKWAVTALEGGPQRLNLIVFRLVEFEGEESWRKVEEFTAEIEVDVTVGQRLARSAWLWLPAGLLLLALLGVGGWLLSARRAGRSVRAEAVPGLAAGEYQRLRRLLLRCGPFDDEDELGAVFADPRIRPWRDRRPQADNATGRVEATMGFLGDAFNQEGENGLVLLLQVLRDRLPAEDDCHQDLDTMARTIRRALRPEEG